MATTTNYSWTTPDDTALVKDGAAAIRSLGTAIDTTVFNNAGAAIAKTIVDAKGDLIAATAADTVARLAVGANDTVLTADSSTATGLKWAAPATGGGWTSLTTGSLSGTTTTVNFTATGYKQVKVFVKNVTASADYNMDVRLNGDSGNNYNWVGVKMTAATTFEGQANSAADNFYVSVYEATANGYFSFTIDDPANTDAHKIFAGIYTAKNTANTFNLAGFVNGRYMSNSAISSITFVMGATASTGTYEIYGVK